MTHAAWVLRSADPVVAFIRDHTKLPVTRANYIGLNWMNDYDASKPLPAELEADIPEPLQLKRKKRRRSL